MIQSENGKIIYTCVCWGQNDADETKIENKC